MSAATLVLAPEVRDVMLAYAHQARLLAVSYFTQREWLGAGINIGQGIGALTILAQIDPSDEHVALLADALETAQRIKHAARLEG